MRRTLIAVSVIIAVSGLVLAEEDGADLRRWIGKHREELAEGWGEPPSPPLFVWLPDRNADQTATLEDGRRTHPAIVFPSSVSPSTCPTSFGSTVTVDQGSLQVTSTKWTKGLYYSTPPGG